MPIIDVDNAIKKRLGVVSDKKALRIEDQVKAVLKDVSEETRDQEVVVESTQKEDPISIILEEDKLASEKYELEYDVDSGRQFWTDLFDSTLVLESQ